MSTRAALAARTDEARRASAWPMALKLFAFALALRWAYSAGMYAAYGDPGLMIGDSNGYVDLAHRFAAAIAAGDLGGWAWLGPDLSLMPLFTWAIALHALALGSLLPLGFVVTQGALDAGTCVLVYLIARSFGERIARAAGFAAALSPTMLVLSGVVYTDTLFVFCATLALYAALRWMRTPGWAPAVLLGVGLAGAATTRVLVLAWVPALLLLAAAILLLERRLALRHLGHLAGAGLIAAAAVAPVFARNASVYYAFSPSPQAGVHLAMWVAPLVREAKDGTPRTRTTEIMSERYRQRFGALSSNPFEESRRYRILGAEELRALGLAAMAKAWLIGAAVNLGSPAVTLVPAVSALPRTGFYDTPGTDFLDKVRNFLFHSDSALYAQLLLAGGLGLLVFRLLQLVGLVRLLRRRANWSTLAVLVGWGGYVLLINGPIASPKYRLPLEPVLAVFAGAGLAMRRPRAGWPTASESGN